MRLIYAASSFYEILLIVLVLVLIFNGLLRRQILNKVNKNLSESDSHLKNTNVQNQVARTSKEEEYVDYEIIND